MIEATAGLETAWEGSALGRYSCQDRRSCRLGHCRADRYRVGRRWVDPYRVGRYQVHRCRRAYARCSSTTEALHLLQVGYRGTPIGCSDFFSYRRRSTALGWRGKRPRCPRARSSGPQGDAAAAIGGAAGAPDAGLVAGSGSLGRLTWAEGSAGEHSAGRRCSVAAGRRMLMGWSHQRANWSWRTGRRWFRRSRPGWGCRAGRLLHRDRRRP